MTIFSKILPWLLKRWYIPVVVLALLLTGYYLWQRWLGPQLQLEETVISIREINEIGELITAEFYGEVVNSYSEAREELQTEIKRQQALAEMEKARPCGL